MASDAEKPRGTPFLASWRHISVSAGSVGLLPASTSKPFWNGSFGRASAFAGGEAAAEALPKGGYVFVEMMLSC
jgi:hypothetical protein